MELMNPHRRGGSAKALWAVIAGAVLAIGAVTVACTENEAAPSTTRMVGSDATVTVTVQPSLERRPLFFTPTVTATPCAKRATMPCAS
jgi:hypothetical protein